MPQESRWYYLEGRNVVGPVSAAQLQQMAHAGTLTPQSQICREGTQDWVEASRLRLDFRGPTMPASTGPAPETGARARAAQAREALAAGLGGESGLLNPAWLFDFRFERSITPNAVAVAWVLWLASSSVAVVYQVIQVIRLMTLIPVGSWLTPIIVLVFLLVGFAFGTLVVRIGLETALKIHQGSQQSSK